MKRRDFICSAALAGAALEVVTGGAQNAQAQTLSCADLPRQGSKEVIRGKRAVASSQHPLVTQTALDV